MQFYRVKQFYRLLDLKTLTEYYSACDGYATNNPTPQAGMHRHYSVIAKSGNKARFSRALFSVLQRISLIQVASALNLNIGDELRYIEQYMQFFHCESFKSFLRQQKREICNNPFAGASISDKEFEQWYHELFDDVRAYNQYMLQLNAFLCKRVTSMASASDTVLGLYAHIPQLVCGLMNRARAYDKFKYLADDAVITALEVGFSKYCSMLSFEEESNCTSIVEKYLGGMMGYFFPYWFTNVAPTLVTSKVLLQGRDSKCMYISDNLKLHQRKETVSPDLYKVLSQVMEMDRDMFRMKKNVADNPVPYYSLVDFVIGVQAKSLCNELNARIQQASGRTYKFEILDTLRSDVMIVNRDASFQTKIENYRNEIQMIYEHAVSLDINNFKAVYSYIADQFTRLAGDHKDSNKAYIDFTSCVQSSDGETIFMPDNSYAKFRNILEAISSLIQVDTALVARGTSLAYIWYRALNSIDEYHCDEFVYKADGYAWATSMNQYDEFSDGYEAQAVVLSVNEDVIYNLRQTLRQLNSKLNGMGVQLRNARISHKIDTPDYDTKLLVAAGAYVISGCGLGRLQIQQKEDVRETIDVIFGFLHQSQLTEDKSSISLEQHYSFEATVQNTTSAENFCFRYVQATLMYALENYDGVVLSGGAMNALTALLSLSQNAFPTEVKEILDILVMAGSSYEFVSAQYQELIPYFTYEAAVAAMQYQLSRQHSIYDDDCMGISQEQRAGQVVLNKLYLIAYLIFKILKSCLQVSGKLQSAILADIKLATDIFIMAVDLNVNLQSALYNGFGVMTRDLNRLSEITPNVYTVEQQAILSNVFNGGSQIANRKLSEKLCGNYTVEQAQILLKLSNLFKQIDTVLLSEIRAVSDLVMSGDSGAYSIEELERHLGSIMPGYRLVLNLNYIYDLGYQELVAHIVCGALKSYLHHNGLSKGLNHLYALKKFNIPLTSYIANETGLSSCHTISRKTVAAQQRSDAFVRDTLVKALDLDEFETKKIIMTNLDASAQLRFSIFRDSLVEDPNTGFLIKCYNEFYSVYNAVNDTFYYLHSSGIFVGYDRVQSKFVFMTYDEAHTASLLGDYS